MAAASEDELGQLHKKVAKVMGNALDQLELQQSAYNAAMAKAIEEEDPEAAPAAEPNLNPALLSVVERFLSNNKITCVPSEGNAMGELERKLKEKMERRQKKLMVVGGTSHDE